MVNHTQNIRRKDVNPTFQVLHSLVDETIPPIFQIFSNFTLIIETINLTNITLENALHFKEIP